MLQRALAPRIAPILVRRLAIALAIAPLLAVLPIARAQPAEGGAAQADIETAAIAFTGEVNAEGALLRCGPSENDYQVMRLVKGQRLTVVGHRYDWLKVVPPDGTFCLVPQAHVERNGDGSRGTVSVDKATVRVGSALSASKTKVSRQLEKSASVRVIGEEQEYYKIAPPEGVFMYVDKKFVVPVRRADADAEVATSAGTPASPGGVPTPTAAPTPDAATPADPIATVNPSDAAAPETGETNADGTFRVKSEAPAAASGAIASGTATAEAIRGLQERLSKLEDRYAAAGQQELSQQPLAELADEYATILADKQLPPNARKVAEFRAGQIKLRQETLTELVASKQAQEAAAQKQRDLKAEQEELAARVAATQVKRYAAVGRLMTSSLQVGDQTLYRLVDPATSRLIVYVRAAKVPVATGLDKFVGINGQVVQDAAANLTYVQPDAFELVDPRQVNSKVFADYSPPSMTAANLATGEASAR